MAAGCAPHRCARQRVKWGVRQQAEWSALCLFGRALHGATERDTQQLREKGVGSRARARKHGGGRETAAKCTAMVAGAHAGWRPARHQRHAATPRCSCPHLHIIHAAAAAWKWRCTHHCVRVMLRIAWATKRRISRPLPRVAGTVDQLAVHICSARQQFTTHQIPAQTRATGRTLRPSPRFAVVSHLAHDGA